MLVSHTLECASGEGTVDALSGDGDLFAEPEGDAIAPGMSSRKICDAACDGEYKLFGAIEAPPRSTAPAPPPRRWCRKGVTGSSTLIWMKSRCAAAAGCDAAVGVASVITESAAAAAEEEDDEFGSTDPAEMEGPVAAAAADDDDETTVDEASFCRRTMAGGGAPSSTSNWMTSIASLSGRCLSSLLGDALTAAFSFPWSNGGSELVRNKGAGEAPALLLRLLFGSAALRVEGGSSSARAGMDPCGGASWCHSLWSALSIDPSAPWRSRCSAASPCEYIPQ